MLDMDFFFWLCLSHLFCFSVSFRLTNDGSWSSLFLCRSLSSNISLCLLLSFSPRLLLLFFSTLWIYFPGTIINWPSDGFSLSHLHLPFSSSFCFGERTNIRQAKREDGWIKWREDERKSNTRDKMNKKGSLFRGREKHNNTSLLRVIEKWMYVCLPVMKRERDRKECLLLRYNN